MRLGVLLLPLFSLLLGGCSRSLYHLKYQIELFLHAHPELLYIAGAVVVIALVAKAFRIAMVLAVLALIVLGFYFLAKMGATP